MPRLLRCLLLLLLISGLVPSTAVMAEEVLLRLNPGGHTSKIQEVVVTPEGQVVTASNDKTIRVWEIEQGQLREQRKLLGQLGAGSEGMIFALALSADGSLLASGGYFRNNEIRLYDFQSGEIKALLKGHENVLYDLAFSPNGQWLASASVDETVRIWPIGSGQADAEA